MNTRQPQFSSDLLNRLTAMGLALVVFGLGLMAVNPALHDWAHQSHSHADETHSDEQHDQPSSDANHSCAIVAYAGGITLAIDTVAPEALPFLGNPTHVVPTESPAIAAPAHLLPQGRGPPIRLS